MILARIYSVAEIISVLTADIMFADGTSLPCSDMLTLALTHSSAHSQFSSRDYAAVSRTLLSTARANGSCIPHLPQDHPGIPAP
jgi:hypothetical protein